MLKPTFKLQNLKFTVAVFLILLLAFALRVYRLDQQSLRGDEAATVLYSAMPVSELWELSRITDPHPPLYYLLLHPWQWLVGEGAWQMRFPGAVAGVLAVAALYRLARTTGLPRPVGLLAAALLAVNPLQIWLAQDIRSYALFTLLGLLSSSALWTALHTSNSHRPLAWSTYVLFTIASLYTHYYTVFLIAFQGLFVLVNARRFWPRRWPWLASQLAIALLILPGLRLAANHIGPAAGGIDVLPVAEILRRAATALLTGFTIEPAWSLGVSLTLTPVALAAMVLLWRQDARRGSFWTLFCLLPVAGVVALSINRPFFKERFLVQAQPAFELLLAAGLVWLTRLPRGRWVGQLAAAGGLALLLFANLHSLTNYHTNPAYAKAPPWRLYHDYVAHESRPGDVMLTNFPEAAVSYYSPNNLPFYVVPEERDKPVEYRLERVRQIAYHPDYRRIWFLPLLRQGFDEQGDVLNWLDRHTDRVNQVFFPAYNLNLYLTPQAIEALMIPFPAKFAHGIHLRGYQVLDSGGKSRLRQVNGQWRLTVSPEDSFTLSLYWQADGPTDTDYTVFTHLIAADGFNRVGQDNPPVWGTYPTTAWQAGEQVVDKYTLTIPAGSPPGDHRLRVGWYRSDTQARVPVLDTAGQPGDDHIVLDVVIQIGP